MCFADGLDAVGTKMSNFRVEKRTFDMLGRLEPTYISLGCLKNSKPFLFERLEFGLMSGNTRRGTERASSDPSMGNASSDIQTEGASSRPASRDEVRDSELEEMMAGLISNEPPFDVSISIANFLKDLN